MFSKTHCDARYNVHVRFGIQRRKIYLTPPADSELEWLREALNREEIWSMFGFSEEAGSDIVARYRSGAVTLGFIRRLECFDPIGFLLVFPPTDELPMWEFSFAIVEASDRDAFSAISATDAMFYYLFEHQRLAALAWRVRTDNRASDAIVRRIGYTPLETRRIGEFDYTFYNLYPEDWEKRKAHLERNAKQQAIFIVLPAPPYTPQLPATSD